MSPAKSPNGVRPTSQPTPRRSSRPAKSPRARPRLDPGDRLLHGRRRPDLQRRHPVGRRHLGALDHDDRNRPLRQRRAGTGRAEPPAGPRAERAGGRSRELDTEFAYSADGTQLQEEIGPMHIGQARGHRRNQEARAYRSIQYNDPAPPSGEPAYNLPTSETTGALVGDSTVHDQRATSYEYNWELRKPTATIVDPEGLKIKSVHRLDDENLGDAGRSPPAVQPRPGAVPAARRSSTTKANGQRAKANWRNAKATPTPGCPASSNPPPRPVGRAGRSSSSRRCSPTTRLAGAAGNHGKPGRRRRERSRDRGGRRRQQGRPTPSKTIEGGGQSIPKVETLYSSTNGQPSDRKARVRRMRHSGLEEHL